MKKFRTFISALWDNLLSPTTRKIFYFSLWVFILLGILSLFKYVFLTSCVTVGNVKECVSSAVDSSAALFAVGSILVAVVALLPVFWTDSKIRDAKKEVSREVIEEIQEKMKDLNKAQILLFEADKYIEAVDLKGRELLIEEAIRLCSSFREEAHRKLGNDFSIAVINRFYPMMNINIANALMQGTTLNREQIKSFLNKAIFYLEETVLNTVTQDREGLVNLACMYGCAEYYDNMIRVIEKVVHLDDNARDDLKDAKRLSLLIFACGSKKYSIEKL